MSRARIEIATPSMDESEWQALKEPISSGWITQGPKVAEFERLFSSRHKVKHAIAASSCTTALHLILAALNIGEGDEVIVPSFTWVATANAVLYCGAKPVLVDVDPTTFNIDPGMIERAISPRTKAIIAVHLFGLCADVDRIKEVAQDIPIVEDAACAVGAEYRGKSAGELGIAAAFSFHPRKIITTGEGGMVTTNDDDIADRIRSMKNHGASLSEEQRHGSPQPFNLPDFNILGFNYRMTDLQGALGVEQMKKLDQLLAEREKWADFYDEHLSQIDWIRTPIRELYSRHSFQSYVTLVDSSKSPIPRNQLMQILNNRGISTRPGIHAIHLLGYYSKRYGYGESDFPGSFASAHDSMAIPLHNQMSAEDYQYVVDTLNEIAESPCAE